MSLPADVVGRVRAAARARSVWFWTALGTLTAVLLLWAGTQLAKTSGQSVEWYTGFGQWLGALGSIIAAVVALWIATSDRRRADQIREDDRAEAAADLARIAGLVLVSAARYVPALRLMPGESQAGVAVRNRRDSPVYDIRFVRFIHGGVEIPDLKFARQMRIYPLEGEWIPLTESLPHLSLEPDQIMVVYPRDVPDDPADYVAVQYTDQVGLRWEVDTKGGPARRVP